MKTTSYALVPAILAACAQPAFASEIHELTAGGRVRVTLQAEPQQRFIGRLASLDDKFLTLSLDPKEQSLMLERKAVSRIQLSRGRSGWRTAGFGIAGTVALGHRERWRTVPLDRFPVAPAGKTGLRLVPMAGGMGASIAVRF